MVTHIVIHTITHIYANTHLHTQTRSHMIMTTLIVIHTRTHTHAHTQTTHTHKPHTHTYIHTHARTHAHTHTHTQTTHTNHTHTHTRTHTCTHTHNKFLFLPIIHLCPFALAVVGHHHGRGQFVHLSRLPLLEVIQPLLANIKYRPLRLVQFLGQLSDVLVEWVLWHVHDHAEPRLERLGTETQY